MLTDIHQHVLFGMDDGASEFQDARKMLREAQKNRISRIIATPHALPGVEPFELMKMYENLRICAEWLKEAEIGIQLYAGAEIYYTDDTLRMLNEERIPTLAGTKYVLIEFSPSETYEKIRSAVIRLGGAGYSPVIAHAERYRCLRKRGNLLELKEEYQALIQVNARTILSPGGFLAGRWLEKALDEGWFDIVASDAHNVGARNNLLLKAYEHIAARKGKEEADRMFIRNPEAVLSHKAL